MIPIKIKVVDWWDNDFYNNYFIQFLSKHYTIIQSDTPDFLLCSVFGNQHLQFDCIKIFFTGEAITPDFNFYDYALGFDHLKFGDRYLRFPLFFIKQYQKALKLAQNKHLFQDTKKLLRRGFCSFVVSNANADSIREEFFHLLSEIDFVASGGRYKNNIGEPISDKLKFLQSYKFNIAFENSSYHGYCTEKLIEALGAQTVPIYWGDPMLKEGGGDTIINPKSFINIQNFRTLNQAVSFIKEMHNNDDLYLHILKEKAFLTENLIEHYENKLEKFFENIFSQNYKDAKRAVLTQRQKSLFHTHKMLYSPPPISKYLRRIKQIIFPRY